MEKHQKFSMWYVLLGIWVVLIIQNALFSAFSVKTISYSEFLKALNENRVTEVAITSNMIQGRMKDSRASSDQGELFRTVRVDPEISELLSGHDVKFKGVDLDCDVFDCDLDRISFCAALANVTGPVIDTPKRVQDRDLELLHTTSAPEPTPSLSVELRSPSPDAFKPQGSVTESSDPAARNVSFWADWVDVRHESRAGKRVGNFRFALEARAPSARSCDRTQD